MNQRILVGVDATVSPPTQQALCTIGTFLATASPQLHVILLHVIPVPALISRTLVSSMRQPHPVAPPTGGQRMQAEQALWSARTLLQQRGIAAERIEILLRVGTPPDELVKAAKELHYALPASVSAGAQRFHALRGGRAVSSPQPNPRIQRGRGSIPCPGAPGEQGCALLS